MASLLSLLGKAWHSAVAGLRKAWHSTVGKLVATLFSVFAGLAILHAYNMAAQASQGAAVTPSVVVANPQNALPIIHQLQRQGFLPPDLTPAELKQAEAQLGLPGGGLGEVGGAPASTTIHYGLPPAVPSPGFGALHIVSQDLTKNTGVTVIPTSYGEVFTFHSVTTTVSQNGASYSLDTAFALAGTQGTAVNASVCGAVEKGSQPWQVQWPTHVPQYSGVIGQPYSLSPSLLNTLQQDGYIQASRVDLNGAPAASTPTNLWDEQPTFGMILSAQGDSASAAGTLVNTLAPGTLYINLELVSKPGESRWRVSEWNYAFSVDTSMANLALGCNPKPAPVQTPPANSTPPQPQTGCDIHLTYCGTGAPPNGQCFSTCSGVTGLPALCNGTYSSVPICLPPGCGTAGLPTCPVTDHMWRECGRRPDHCVWPILIGPVSGKWGVAVHQPGTPAQYIGGTDGPPLYPSGIPPAPGNPYANTGASQTNPYAYNNAGETYNRYGAVN